MADRLESTPIGERMVSTTIVEEHTQRWLRGRTEPMEAKIGQLPAYRDLLVDVLHRNPGKGAMALATTLEL